MYYFNENDCKNHKNKLLKIKNYKLKIPGVFSLNEACNTLIYNNDSKKIQNMKKYTFEFIFKNYEAGAIYVEIIDGKINKNIALINDDYYNTWHKYVKKFNPYIYNKNKGKDIYNNYNSFLKKDSKLLPINKWKKNGALIQMFEYYDDNNKAVFDSYQYELLYLINETVNKYKINDISFILWTKDIPLLSKTGQDIYLNENKWIHKTKNYLPIFSQSSIDNFYDIAIPNADEIRTFSQLYIYDNCKFDDINKINKYKWNSKIEKGFFRGSATGCSNDINLNPRLKISYLTMEYPYLLDAGVIKFGYNRDKISQDGKIDYFKNNLKINLLNKIPMYDFGKYKYILNIEGNGLAYRKSFLFYFKSLVLNVESKFKSWFDSLLIPYEHYIPIKSDLSDLITQIKWCKENDDKCKIIAKNGYNFAKKHFNMNFFKLYISELLNLNNLDEL